MDDMADVVTQIHESTRLELMMSIPIDTVAKLLADITVREADDVICLINTADHPGVSPAEIVLAVVDREVLFETLGPKHKSLGERKAGCIPFVVTDRFGVTVVMVKRVPLVRVNAVGGDA